MKLITNRIPKIYQKFIFSNLALSWITGISFFYLNTWAKVEGEFGPEKHFLQSPILQIHAASAFLIMILFGALLFAHMPRAWKIKHSRKSGIALLIVFSIQIVTAYMLYYLSHETSRMLTSYIHLFCGLSIPFVLISHILAHKKAKAIQVRSAHTNQ